jgi:uncharacterized FlaG/YvyC family protein
MTRPKGQKRFAEMKRMIKLTDARLKAKDRVKPKNHDKKQEKKNLGEIIEKQVAPVTSALFFRYNTQLGILIIIYIYILLFFFKVLHITY